MRHRKRTRVFNRPTSARATLIRHLSRSLLLEGSIETTIPKAKETGRFTERLIQLGIRGDLIAYRRAFELLKNSETTSFLFKEVAPLFKDRKGGYTRMLRHRTRPGDGAELAILELVEKKEKLQPEKKAKERVIKKEKPKETHLPSPPLRKEEGPAPSKGAEEPKKEKKEKSGGFFANLRKFIKPKDRA